MTPQRCISGRGEFGDCWRACIASILDLPAEQVPHFFGLAGAATDPDGSSVNAKAYALAAEWLAPRGLGIFRFWTSGRRTLNEMLDEFGSFSPEVPFIIHGEPGPFAKGEQAHAVVAVGNQVVHDPSGAGISGPCPCDCGDSDCKGWWWIDVIGLAAKPKEPTE